MLYYQNVVMSDERRYFLVSFGQVHLPIDEYDAGVPDCSI